MNESQNKTKLLVISGSSGVGKGTVIKSLLEKCPDLNLSISCTTRNKREGEVHGVNYFYLTQEEFDSKMAELTASLQQFFDEGNVLQKEIMEQLKKVKYE